MDILEHFSITDCAALLWRISEKLNPGGKLLIHVPNGEGLFGQRIRYGDLTHETCFTPKSMIQLVEANWFQRHSMFRRSTDHPWADFRDPADSMGAGNDLPSSIAGGRNGGKTLRAFPKHDSCCCASGTERP